MVVKDGMVVVPKYDGTRSAECRVTLRSEASWNQHPLFCKNRLHSDPFTVKTVNRKME